MGKCDEKTEQLDNINYSKTILMMIIVVYHSMCFFTGKWFNQEPIIGSTTIPVIVDFLNSFHIYAFTLISGYVFYYLQNERFRYINLKSLVKAKFQRLVIPYIFTSLLWVIPFYIKYFDTNILQIIKKYVLGTSPNQLWFVLMLFWVFLIAQITWKLLTKNLLLGVATVGILFIFGCVGQIIFPNVYQILTALQYIMFFWIGMMLRKHNDSFLYEIPAILYISIYVLIFFVKELDVFSVKNMMLKTGVDICITTILNIIGAVMAFFALNKLSSKIKNKRILDFLGKYSFSVYLFHQQIIYCVIDKFNGKIVPLTMVFLCFTLSLSVSLIISLLLSKNRFTRKCIGMK